MDARVERVSDARLHRSHALALEKRPELAVDGSDADRPRVGLQCGGTGLDRAIEVVQRVEDLETQGIGRTARGGRAVLFAAALEVDELGTLPLEPCEVLVGVGLGLVPLGREPLELGEELGRRDVDIGDAFFGACSMRHGFRWLPARVGWVRPTGRTGQA